LQDLKVWSNLSQIGIFVSSNVWHFIV